jgi:hypothetical protein
VLAEMCPKCGNPAFATFYVSVVADSQHRLMTSTAARGTWHRPAKFARQEPELSSE